MKEKVLDDHTREVLVRGGGGLSLSLSHSHSLSLSRFLSFPLTHNCLTHNCDGSDARTISIHSFLQQKLIQVDLFLKRSCFFKSFCTNINMCTQRLHTYIYVCVFVYSFGQEYRVLGHGSGIQNLSWITCTCMYVRMYMCRYTCV